VVNGTRSLFAKEEKTLNLCEPSRKKTKREREKELIEGLRCDTYGVLGFV
jgi:hypothetical protein